MGVRRMDGLLNDVINAHGGAQRWQSVSSITARGRLGGLLPRRFPGNKLANFTVEVQPDEPRTVLRDFPRTGENAVFDRGEVRIENHAGETLGTRTNRARCFSGSVGFAATCAGTTRCRLFRRYAFWNYLTVPMLLTRNDITVTEGESWQECGQQWRSCSPHSRH